MFENIANSLAADNKPITAEMYRGKPVVLCEFCLLYTSSCLFGEIDRLLEKPGGDMLPACLAGTLPTLKIRVFFYHVGCLLYTSRCV